MKHLFSWDTVMTLRTLHLQTSPLGDASVSRLVGQAVVAQLPTEAQLDTLDLADRPVPHWTPAWASSEHAQALVTQILATDLLIVEAPMYNFGIPSTLKSWLDTIAVAGRTFAYTAEGPVGELKKLQVVVVSSRGGAWGEGHALDFQEAYLRHFFAFLGVTAERIQVIRAEGLAMGETVRAAAIARALAATLTVHQAT
jgi:FMN-dependent NADH-azoreductase